MIKLTHAKPEDYPYLKSLEAEVMGDHAKALWGVFAAPEFSSFDLANTRIIRDEDRALGYVTVEPAEDHLRLRKLYLDPEVQGQGIGAELLRQIRSEAEAEGLPLRLSVLRPNQRAIDFYLREGLTIAEETPERIFLQTPSAA
jgi:GNAT superfamily N-acetyltransferase